VLSCFHMSFSKSALKFFDRLLGKMLEIIIIFLVVYSVLPVLSPILLHFGYNIPGAAIQRLYRGFCHQWADRSLFLFGDKAFYSTNELIERGVIPEESYLHTGTYMDNHYGYPFYGNPDIGFKVAYCIRDMALYSMLSLTSVVLYVYLKRTKRSIKVPLWLYGLLLLPMAFDGAFQTIAELTDLKWVPVDYINSIAKRILTGGLFGIGFGLFVVTVLWSALHEEPNSDKKESRKSEKEEDSN